MSSIYMRLLASLLLISAATALQGQVVSQPCPNGQPVPSPLHLPQSLPAGEPVQFEKQVLAYLSTLAYRQLGWCEDKEIRDTGPFMNKVSAGVHPSVRVFYSPEVSRWLLGGRQGEIPDGAVILKEQFASTPAALVRERQSKDPKASPGDWTFMIRNAKASRDGWFWGEVWSGTGSGAMNFTDPYQYPNAGYGLTCLRCHASAENQLTFSSLHNIQGGAGWPLQYHTDNSWRPLPAGLARPNALLQDTAAPASLDLRSEFPMHGQNAAIQSMQSRFLKAAAMPLPLPPGLQRMPPEPLDTVLAPPGMAAHEAAAANGSLGLVTSSQCMGCHSGLNSASLGPTMVLSSADASFKMNVSPYGEWRWSPLGLAGRDPVFFSQLDSELVPLPAPAAKQDVINICLTCHGAMGLRSFQAEHPGENFDLKTLYETDPSSPNFRYGGLARDGISCEVCHRMAAPREPSLAYFLEHQINGHFNLVPANELNGPFKDAALTTYPMVTSLGIKPKHSDYIQSSQMCGTCHTILLPVLDDPAKSQKTSVEQATYVEWLNSSFRKEYGSVGSTPKSCQDCHMPGSYQNAAHGLSVPQVQDKIAIVQDLTYPASDHTATPEQMNVRFRETGFRRHELLGTNGFLLQMFARAGVSNGNNDVLGVRLPDYMTGLSDLDNASANVVRQAAEQTADVRISDWRVAGRTLILDVTVTNLVGHRFPSGVGFRRAFLEVRASAADVPFWSSGTTNEKGEITDFHGKVLPTESFAAGQYQPHFSQAQPIRSDSQVQIYEELMQDHDHHFTTGFTRRDYPVKDNRLLPLGWSPKGPSDLRIPEPYLDATQPVGGALRDPVYLAGKGQSIVRYEIPLPASVDPRSVHVTTTLYSQTMPPYFLADRARTASPATARLDYLVRSLGTLKDTSYANWKLPIRSATH